MNEFICFICGKRYFNESETIVQITRIKRELLTRIKELEQLVRDMHVCLLNGEASCACCERYKACNRSIYDEFGKRMEELGIGVD